MYVNSTLDAFAFSNPVLLRKARFKSRLIARDKGCVVCMAQNQNDDSMYLYEVDSEMFIGAHIFPLQYNDLVRRVHPVCGSLTTILLSGIEEGIHGLLLTRTQLLVLLQAALTARTLTRAV